MHGHVRGQPMMLLTREQAHAVVLRGSWKRSELFIPASHLCRQTTGPLDGADLGQPHFRSLITFPGRRTYHASRRFPAHLGSAGRAAHPRRMCSNGQQEGRRPKAASLASVSAVPDQHGRSAIRTRCPCCPHRPDRDLLTVLRPQRHRDPPADTAPLPPDKHPPDQLSAPRQHSHGIAYCGAVARVRPAGVADL